MAGRFLSATVATAVFVMGASVMGAHAQGSSYGGAGAVLLVLALACYLLPTIIAFIRGKANGTGGVLFVNLVLGWTVVGWFVSFIWACSGQTREQLRREETRHRELMAALKEKGSP